MTRHSRTRSSHPVSDSDNTSAHPASSAPSRDGKQFDGEGRALQYPLRVVPQLESRADDASRRARNRREEDILRARRLQLSHLRREAGIGRGIRNLGHVMQVIGADRLFITLQTIRAVIIVLIDNSGRGILDTELVDN